MIIYVLVLLLILIVGSIKNWNSSKARKKQFLFLIFLILITIASLRSSYVGSDLRAQYANYYRIIAGIDWNQWDLLRFEWGYFALCKTLTYISSDPQALIIVSSIITFSCTAFFIYKNSDDVVMSTFLFVSLNQMFMYYTGLRQVLALSIILLALEVLKRNKLFLYVLFVLVASLFHASAWITLLFIPCKVLKFKRKGILISIAGTMVVLIFYQRLYNTALSFFSRYSDYSESGRLNRFYGGNVNFYSIVTVLIVGLIFILAIYEIYIKNGSTLISADATDHSKKKSGNLSTDFILYGTMFAVLFQLFVFTLNILTRFRIYFFPITYLAVPSAILRIRNLKNRTIVRCLFYSLYSAYFLFVCFQYADSQWGVVPYMFFWQT